jgi:hypothetical protein
MLLTTLIAPPETVVQVNVGTYEVGIEVGENGQLCLSVFLADNPDCNGIDINIPHSLDRSKITMA